MRKLVILRGSMGSGKSTWLKENDLEKYTLCADTIRLNLSAPQIGIDGKDTISQKENKQAWDILFYFLEERMKRGEFTIIDAVHSKSSELSRYKDLADKYRYRLYCVDFTDTPISIAKERNLQRPEYKQVPEEAIDKVYSRFAIQEKMSGFTVVKPNEFFTKVVNTKPFDWNKYNNIHIFGDIHGCYEPLKKYFEENPYTELDGYIFIGDYFDRGIQNVEVFNFIEELINKDNTLFLTGNHEIHLRDYAFGYTVKSKEFLNKTAIQFANAGIDKLRLRQFYRRLGQVAYITFRGYDFIISHGGIPYMPSAPLDFYSTDSFIKGIGSYEYNVDEKFDNWAQKVNGNKIRQHEIYQVHGHRNLYDLGLPEKEFSYNLEGKIEFGGQLRVLKVTNEGAFITTFIENTVFDESLLEQKKDPSNDIFDDKINDIGLFLQDLRENKYIQEKDLGDGISSFNFSRKAFDKGIWDNITTQARGLFIDTEKNKIQARSYNKFFNKNEKEETKLENLLQNLKFPVRFYKKYNGFLGILSMRNGELYFCSKSSNNSDHTGYFKNIFYAIYNTEQIEAIKNILKKEDKSMVFEVIDPVNDPHIIKYNKPAIILLDIIYNTIDFKKLDYENLASFGQRNNIKVKEVCYEVSDLRGFIFLNEILEATDYKYNNEYIEGFVVEDATGFMFKYKLYYYTTWKFLRGVLNKYMKNPTDINSLITTTPLENYFLRYLKDKYPNGEKSYGHTIQTNIISERDDFIKNGGNEI